MIYIIITISVKWRTNYRTLQIIFLQVLVINLTFYVCFQIKNFNLCSYHKISYIQFKIFIDFLKNSLNDKLYSYLRKKQNF